MNGKLMTYAAYLAAFAGVMLHIYLTLFHTMSGSIAFKIVPALHVVPYLICVSLVRLKKKPIMPLCAAILVLLTDLCMFQDYLISDQTFRYMFIETMQIVMKTVIILPIGYFIGNMVDKFMNRGAEKKTG
jgi:hypothetical protein